MANAALATKQAGGVLNEIRHNPIATITEQYAQLAQFGNTMFPPTVLDNLPAMHKPSVTIIQVDWTEQSKDTYPTENGLRGLSKNIINKMIAAAGGSYKTQKLSPDSDLDNIRWSAQFWCRQPDGSMVSGQGTKSWSWLKCQERCKTDVQARKERNTADEMTETKAVLRAARGILGIKTSYSIEELKKPFVFLKAVPDLDVSDPEIKRMVTQRMLDSTYALYGNPESTPALPPAFDEIPAVPTADEFNEEEEDIHNADFQAEASFDPEVDPFAMPEVPAGGPPPCFDCNKQIVAVMVGGKNYTVSEIVDITETKYGKPLCFACSVKVAK